MIRFDPQKRVSPSTKTGRRRQGLIDASSENSLANMCFSRWWLQAFLEKDDQDPSRIGRKIAVIEFSHEFVSTAPATIADELALIKYEGSQLDAFAWGNVSRSSGIDESGVRHETRATVFCGVEAFQQQYLVGPHRRHVIPVMRRPVSHQVVPAGPVAIDQVGGDPVFGCNAAGVAQRERRIA